MAGLDETAGTADDYTLNLTFAGTDGGLAHLTELTALETLGVGGTGVTDAGLAELRKTLPNF